MVIMVPLGVKQLKDLMDYSRSLGEQLLRDYEGLSKDFSIQHTAYNLILDAS